MGVGFDGSVIEVSTDAGTSWQDISMFGDPGYPGTIGMPMPQSSNALNNRKGFVDQNPSYPAMDPVTVDMGTSLAGKTVQVRFRIGTDDAKGAPGWQLDDFAFAGITNAPFSGVVDDVDGCPGAAGGGAAVGGAAGSGGSAIGGSSAAGASAGGAAGKGGTKAAGGGSTAGAPASGGSTVASAPTSAPEATGGGCACSTTSVSAGSRASFALALLGVGAALGRRRRRGRNPG